MALLESGSLFDDGVVLFLRLRHFDKKKKFDLSLEKEEHVVLSFTVYGGT